MKVSVMCLTYNHKNFIREALDSFVMQKTTFPFEILVHDDASTDGTDDIVREYIAKYPDLVRGVFQTENQFTKTGEYPYIHIYKLAKGEYIANCDGDDYWVDPLSLQIRVDFMDAHPEYIM